jgi:hypothetical protein
LEETLAAVLDVLSAILLEYSRVRGWEACWECLSEDQSATVLEDELEEELEEELEDD